MSKRSWHRRSWWWCGCWAAWATGPMASSRSRKLPPPRHPAGRPAGRRSAGSGTGAVLDSAGRCGASALAIRRAWRRRECGGFAALCGSPDRVRGSRVARAGSADAGRDLLAGPGSAVAGRPAPGMGSRAPVAAIVFYRALEQAANTAVIDALIAALGEAGVNALPIATTSLKEKVAAGIVTDLLDRSGPDVILNATSFAVSQPGRRDRDAVRQCGLPGVAGGVLRRVGSGVARRDLRAFRPRHRHERGAARGRRPHHHPRRQLQGGGPAPRDDGKLGAVVSAGAGPGRVRRRAGGALGAAAPDAGGAAARRHRYGELPEPGRAACQRRRAGHAGGGGADASGAGRGWVWVTDLPGDSAD